MKILKKLFYTICTTCRPKKSRTVRYAFPVILGALLIFGASAITSLNETTIEVEPRKNTVSAGENIAIDVYVSAHTPVNAVDLSLAIPESQLEVTGIDVGESVITLWTVDPFVDNGIVILRGGTFRKGFLGKHLIATIQTKAVDSGVAEVNVTNSLLLAGDGSGTEVLPAQSGSEEAKLYIADSYGVVSVPTTDNGSVIEGSIEIRIITDIDGDGNVSLNDVSRFMSAWQSKSVVFDFSGDGQMTFRDFAIILADSFLH